MIGPKRSFWIGLIILCLFLVQPVTSKYKPLYTYYNFSLGTKALSMGNAFTAVADDLSAVFWNPAGLADLLYPIVSLNYHMDGISYSHERQENIFDTGKRVWTEDFDSESSQIDFLSISVPASFWNMKWNLALSYYHYISYDVRGSRESELTVSGEGAGTQRFTETFSGTGGIDVLGFSMAVYLTEYFSIGFTLQHFFNSGSIRYGFQSNDRKYEQEFSERLQGQNLIFGCLLKLEKNLQIGFAYHSGIEDVFTSESRYENITDNEIIQESSSSEIVIPAQFSLGLAVKPLKNWLLAYDFSKILWSKGKISNYYDHVGDLPFPVRDDYEQDQRNIVNHRLGTEINVVMPKAVFYIRGGLFWERQLFIDANDEAIWIKGFSLGLGVQLFSKILIDLAYMNQSASWKETGYFSAETLVDTRYQNHIFAFSITYIF
ncbi:MAG: outer membrane protein transport protein [Candidatus Aminicenantes bacterium]|nr:outer membrane protein transport protein [Candidatus Aminicenantes bacterium]